MSRYVGLITQRKSSPCGTSGFIYFTQGLHGDSEMERLLSFTATSLQERIKWAFSVKTENINQKFLLCFLVSISDELNYFEWPLSSDDCLMQSLSNMTDSDIGHAFCGLLRIGLVSFCRWDCNVNKLNFENKVGAEF